MLEAVGKPATCRDLDVIFREGDAGGEMYVIKSGRVKLTKKTHGIVATIATLEAGDFFAEMSLFDDAPRSATATAVGKVELVAYDKQTLTDSIARDPAIALSMLAAMSRRIRAIDDELAQLVAKGLLPKEQATALRRYTFAGAWQ